MSLGGVCVGHTSDIVLDVGCELIRAPISTEKDHRARLVRIAHLELEGNYAAQMHLDCAHNQLRSLVGRVAGVVVKPTAAGLRELASAARIIKNRSKPIPEDDVFVMAQRYSGNKRARYERATTDLTTAGLFPHDSHVTMFVKKEKLDPAAKVNPDPRAIQFRGPKYCVALARYLHPIEMILYQIDYFSKGVGPNRNIVKGLNQAQRAQLLVEKSREFRDPVYICLDASRFDKHVTQHLLRHEHSVYLWFNSNPDFEWLLSLQLINYGRSKLGLKYKLAGRRMSGDMNTALGNCIIMLTLLYAYCVYLMIERFDMIVDGDDSVVIVEREDVDKVVNNLAHTLEYGMTMKIETLTDKLHQIDFCQSRIIEYDSGRYKFVRNPSRVMSRSLSGCRHWENSTYRARTLRAIGFCELSLSLGVPILQAFSSMLIRNTAGYAVDTNCVNEWFGYRAKLELRALGVPIDRLQPTPISLCARVTFMEAFGVPIEEQIRIEDRFEQMVLNLDDLHMTEELTVATWLHELDFSNCYRI